MSDDIAFEKIVDGDDVEDVIEQVVTLSEHKNLIQQQLSQLLPDVDVSKGDIVRIKGGEALMFELNAPEGVLTVSAEDQGDSMKLTLESANGVISTKMVENLDRFNIRERVKELVKDGLQQGAIK